MALIAGGAVTVAALVGGGEDPGLAIALFGMPAAMLGLFFASLGLIVSRTRDAVLMMRWTLIAGVASFFTPIALLAAVAAGGGGTPHPGELVFLAVSLALGPGAFSVLWREMFRGARGQGRP